MSMMKEIEKLMGDIGSDIDYRIINLGGKSVYIEGIKSVISFGENELQFQLKKMLLSVLGNELKVKYLDASTCVVLGKIMAVETK